MKNKTIKPSLLLELLGKAVRSMPFSALMLLLIMLAFAMFFRPSLSEESVSMDTRRADEAISMRALEFDVDSVFNRNQVEVDYAEGTSAP